MTNTTAKFGAAVLMVAASALPLSVAAMEDRDLKIWIEGMNEMTSDSDRRLGLLEKISLGADLRFRYETFAVENTIVPRERARIRARFMPGFKVNDQVSIKMQLVSGGSDPVSTNQSLDSFASTKGFLLDRAYFEVGKTGWSLDPVLKAGKFGVPFVKPGKEQLLWDGDLNLEGLSISLKHKMGPVGASLVGGYFFLRDVSGLSKDPSLQGAQAVLDTKLFGAKIKGGAGYFNYNEVKGQTPGGLFGNMNDGTGKLLFDYELLEALAELELAGPSKSKIKFYGDYSRNLAASRDVVLKKLGLAAAGAFDTADWDEAWMLGLEISSGKIFEHQKDFLKLKYNYREVESDAVFGAFTDSDFIGGGTSGKAGDKGRGLGHKVALGIKLPHDIGFEYTMLMNQLPTDYLRQQIDLKVAFK